MSPLFQWVIDRAGEKTTWAGLALLVGSFGHAVPPQVADVLQTYGPVLAAALVTASERKRS